MSARWRLPILIAAPYMVRDMMAVLGNFPRPYYRLMIDSGAFTAHTLGKKITVAGYANFLRGITHLAPFDAVQLDVIGDPAATWRNYLELREADACDTLLPVVTVGASGADAARAFETSDYVLLGGLVGYSDPPRAVRWMRRRTPPGKRVHWLGLSSVSLVDAHRPCSIDSSTWTAAQRYGQVAVYTGDGRRRMVKREDFDAPAPWLRSAFASLGMPLVELERLRHPVAWQNLHYHRFMGELPECRALFANALSYVAQAHEIERRTGTVYYLSTAGANDLRLLHHAYRFYTERCPYYARALGRPLSPPTPTEVAA